MNDAMTLGLHRCWKDDFVSRLSGCRGADFLDVAGGTGDIAFRIVENGLVGSAVGGHVTVCDINEKMLEVGRQRSLSLKSGASSLSFLQGNAEQLTLPDSCMDVYTIAFGIRNVTNIPAALKEAYRVLRPGGRFLCLEFSRVENPLLRPLYDQYSFQVIPVLGHLLAGEMAPYQYLVESIRKFPAQQEFQTMIRDAGFSMTSYDNLTFGVVAIHSGFKLPK
eukprot:gnl/Hemi2/3921_TR1376_c0_g1_i1.p1 gnl/Hemi2/3921_TR1376_c0_g1~~gnl/Hemi2/3921_TR1376_c0_g1_i1.p1  ORF type:complete len:236 (+),score=59.38 gnl/Hemi2/3921_TR1376_c0_g1_i1:48-710(+)